MSCNCWIQTEANKRTRKDVLSLTFIALLHLRGHVVGKLQTDVTILLAASVEVSSSFRTLHVAKIVLQPENVIQTCLLFKLLYDGHYYLVDNQDCCPGKTPAGGACAGGACAFTRRSEIESLSQLKVR